MGMSSVAARVKNSPISSGENPTIGNQWKGFVEFEDPLVYWQGTGRGPFAQGGNNGLAGWESQDALLIEA